MRLAMRAEALSVSVSDGNDGRTSGPSTATAVLGTVILATVALVPAVAPGAAAATAQVDPCIPADPPADVGLVIDRSGSMSGVKIEQARDGAVGFVENLTGNDQSGLVSYANDEDVTLDDPLSFNHTSTIEAIENLTAGGGTATGDAINLSHADLGNRSRSDRRPTMVLLTDGRTNEGLDPVEQARQAKEDGVEIFAIGLGDDVNEEALRTIASDPVASHYHNPQSSDELETVYGLILEEATKYSIHAGEAYGLQATAETDQAVREVTATRQPQAVAPPDGDDSAARESVTVAGVTVTVHGMDVAAGGETTPWNVSADASTVATELVVRDGSTTLLQADLLEASARAHATPNGTGTAGTATTLEGISVMGVPVEPPIPADTTVDLGDAGSATLKERTVRETDGNASVRVTLVNLTLEDGPRTLDVRVGSAYAAAACSVEAAHATPDRVDPGADGEAVDDETQAGPAAVNPGGCAEGEVAAASATGCGDGQVAASGTEEARNTASEGDCGSGDVCAAASGSGDATNAGDDCDDEGACVAASGTGDAQNAGTDCEACVAASATGDARNAGRECDFQSPCLAVSGTGDARNADTNCAKNSACVAASGTGDAENATDECDSRSACLAVSGTGDARNAGTECGDSACVAASGTGDASNAGGACEDRSACVAASGTGNGTAAEDDCEEDSFCVGVSGGSPSDPVALETGAPCQPGDCADVTLEDDADGEVVAASATGDATGLVALTGTGSAHADRGVAVSGTGPASSDLGAAVSGTGDAGVYLGVAVSGCNGVTADLLVADEGADSPAPVCSAPAGDASLLP